MNVNSRSGLCVRFFLTAVVLTAMMGAAFSAAALAEQPARQTQLYLVGMGPGDPDLITLRAIRVIEKADVVFVSPSIAQKFTDLLDGKQVVEGFWRLFPYYGVDPADVPPDKKQEYDRMTAQRNAFITQVRTATAEGKVVAIADNGDPLVYGPWSWILEEFTDLDPVVVPGLSCFNAGNAALRRSITSGENTKSVILTADDWPGMTDTIEELSKLRATMVLFTMKADFEKFITKLRAGWPPETPVAVVQHAGYAEKERVIEAKLGTILDQVDGRQLPFEYMIYVGDFLTHRHKKNQTE
jgi:precorrin-4 methylase